MSGECASGMEKKVVISDKDRDGKPGHRTEGIGRLPLSPSLLHFQGAMDEFMDYTG